MWSALNVNDSRVVHKESKLYVTICLERPTNYINRLAESITKSVKHVTNLLNVYMHELTFNIFEETLPIPYASIIILTCLIFSSNCALKWCKHCPLVIFYFPQAEDNLRRHWGLHNHPTAFQLFQRWLSQTSVSQSATAVLASERLALVDCG